MEAIAVLSTAAVSMSSREIAELTQDRLRSLLNYDPATGEFTWRVSRGSRKAGSRTGCIGSTGYVIIGVDGKLYGAHQLAWLYVYGEWPEHGIDQVDGDMTANEISNLRKANQAENMQNKAMPISNTSGFMGVRFHKGSKKYCAEITAFGKREYLGLYETAELAFDAYKAAKRKLHSFNPEVPSRSGEGKTGSLASGQSIASCSKQRNAVA